MGNSEKAEVPAKLRSPRTPKADRPSGAQSARSRRRERQPGRLERLG